MAVSDWFSSPTVIGWAGVIAVVVVGVATILYERWKERERRIEYSISDLGVLSDEPVTDSTEPASAHSEAATASRVPGEGPANAGRYLRGLIAGAAPQHLRVVRLKLRNRSEEIKKTEFASPLRFDLGVRIAAILNCRTEPDNGRFQPVDAVGSVVEVGPAIIAKDQTVAMMLLVEGATLTVTPLQRAIERVELRKVTGGEQDRTRLSLRGKIGWGLLAAATAGALFLTGRAVVPSSAVTGTPGIATPTDSRPLTLAEADNDLASRDSSIQAAGLTAIGTLLENDQTQQPTILSDLSTYIRETSTTVGSNTPVSANVQSALDLIRQRDSAYDNGTVINLEHANLTNADLARADLDDADLNGANLTDADFNDANLGDTSFGGANLTETTFTAADLSGAQFGDTTYCKGSTPSFSNLGYSCRQ